MRKRDVQPEILDSLPHDDPEAIGSRRDLKLINALMGNFRWIHRSLSRELPSLGAFGALELGAGDGTLGAKLAAKSPHPQLSLGGLDLAGRPPTWPEAWDWCAGDLFDTLPERGEPVVIANLILHHFSDPQLRDLGRLLADRRLLVFSEPSRARWHHLQAYALYPFGINRVTRHDMHASIRAGFSAGELPQLLGLDAQRWLIQESHHPLGAQRLLAIRR